ncbi:uncharacterized protein EAF02_005703 [Botrytis sinoallii]|uniref:uncharacterized protein n=1 Tax=Botrytis sinoallii TaxID=1463999 RepID=UPI001902B516|nr:uncharacterized protein EAF02_005703 [Botrytis sinoallii]KAF7882340.1 hypothetical protein EAF02_005703 [Botrytis sinoallii]
MKMEITKGIHLAARSLWGGIPPPGQKNGNSYSGKFELRQLLDWELIHASSPRFSQQHELAWIPGCLNGVRPCSLAQLLDRPGKFLRWRDIEITRLLMAKAIIFDDSIALSISCSSRRTGPLMPL